MTKRHREGSAEPLSPVLVFAAVLGVLVAITTVVWMMSPVSRGRSITRADRPSADHYLAHDHGGHVDHHVLYFGTDAEALAQLGRADVLFVGNSRLLFAARPGILDPAFAAWGLRYYVLGFGFREADRFPLAIIEKFDLRPAAVIVNVDGFFEDRLSDFARTVMKDTRFGAWKLGVEAEAGHEVRRAVHLLVPNYVDLLGRPGFPWRREFVVYRSRANGSWQPSPWEAGTAPVRPRDLSFPVAARELAAARRFKAAIEARGGRLILTAVPTPRPSGGGPVRFAELLGVPLVAVHPPGLMTEDDDHLDEPSAVAWSEAFVRDLGRVFP